MRTMKMGANVANYADGPRAKWLLIGAILLAISLRVWGITFGLPYFYHADEPRLVRFVQAIFKSGDLNPHFFDYPSLFFYIHVISYIPYYLVGKLVGVFHSRADIAAPVSIVMGVGKTMMPSTFLLGRTVTMAFSLAAVALTFLSGRRLAGRTAVGLLAALMMAVSPTNVENSRLIKPDTFQVFFVMLSFWGAVQVFQHGKTWQYMAAGIAAGLAAGTKYNGALIIVSVVSAHFLRYGLKGVRERRVYLALAVGAAAFLVTTPFAILNHGEFLAGLQYTARHYSTGHVGMEGNTLVWYATYLLRFEGPVALLAVVEILRGIHARSKPIILLSVFPVAYFIFISRFVVRNAQALLPLTPFVLLLASSLLVYLLGRVKSWPSNVRRLSTFAVVVLVIVSLAWPFLRTVEGGIRLTTVDSRETARVWIYRNLPYGARIAIEAYAPYVDPERHWVEGSRRMIDHTPDWYRDNGFAYLVFSQGMFGRFYREPQRYSTEVAQYEELFGAFDLVKTFTDGGYEVRIYAVTK